MRVELSVAHHLYGKSHAVANNLRQRLCDQGAIALINPIFCEPGLDADNKGGSRLVDTKKCGATEPGLEGGLRKADLQLSEDRAPDLSLIHSAAPPFVPLVYATSIAAEGRVAEESAVPPWCKIESVLTGLRQPLPQPRERDQPTV